MAKKELKLHAVVSPTETVVVSAYDENGKADACIIVPATVNGRSQ